MATTAFGQLGQAYSGPCCYLLHAECNVAYKLFTVHVCNRKLFIPYVAENRYRKVLGYSICKTSQSLGDSVHAISKNQTAISYIIPLIRLLRHTQKS